MVPGLKIWIPQFIGELIDGFTYQGKHRQTRIALCPVPLSASSSRGRVVSLFEEKLEIQKFQKSLQDLQSQTIRTGIATYITVWGQCMQLFQSHASRCVWYAEWD